MDGDGDMDILSESYIRSLVAWFENDGTGGSWSRHDVSSTGEMYSPRACYPVDIDGDGDNDIILGDGGPDAQIIWYENLNIPDSWPAHTVASAPLCYDLHTVDIDQDGDIDILSANWWINNELNL